MPHGNVSLTVHGVDVPRARVHKRSVKKVAKHKLT